MNEKYLPIGTVVMVKGLPKKIMITGYLSIEFLGKVKMFDYIGYDYPEGMLCNNKSHSFNHIDIEKILYLGYAAEEHQALNHILKSENIEKELKQESHSTFSNFRFDENGVVVFESPNEKMESQNKQTPAYVLENKQEEIINPFKEEVKIPIEVSQPDENVENWSIFRNFKFDENGVVIAEE